jgi:hypothetical protein
MGVACGVSDGNSSAEWRLITMGGRDEAHDFMDETAGCSISGGLLRAELQR